MTTIDTAEPTLATPDPPPSAEVASMVDVFISALRAELTKLRSVRSTMWSFLVTLALTIGLGALFCAARVSRWDRLGRGDRFGFDAAGFSLNGIFLAQLAIGVLGVLVMSSEYATGQIRATFGATPQRLVVLAAKVVVFTAVTFVVSLGACLAAFGIGQAIFVSKHAGVSLRDPTVLRAVVGGALYLTVLGAFAIALGAILRRTAGAIAALVGILLILPILTQFLPSPWSDDISKFLPSEAGRGIFHVVIDRPSDFAPWVGFGLFCGYTVILLVVAAVLLVRRDP